MLAQIRKFLAAPESPQSSADELQIAVAARRNADRDKETAAAQHLQTQVEPGQSCREDEAGVDATRR